MIFLKQEDDLFRGHVIDKCSYVCLYLLQLINYIEINLLTKLIEF